MIAKICLVVLAICAVSQATSSSAKETLARDLLRDYLKEVDPGKINLTAGVSYVCAHLNKETKELTSKVLEKYGWSDPRLRWVPAEHGGITHLRLPATLIWTPDFKLFNAMEELESRTDVHVVLGSDGSVIWIPTVTYKTFCSAKSEADQSSSCKLQLGSWTYDADNIVLKAESAGIDTEMYLDTCPYTISDAKAKVESKKYPCCPELYSSMEVTFKVHPRK